MDSQQPPSLTREAFVDKFVTPVIARYEQRSKGAKRKWQTFYAFQYFFILLTPSLGGVLPFFYSGNEQALRAATAVSGLLAAYLTHLISSGNYQKNFIDYDVTHTALDVQYALFSAGAKPYDTPDACKVFATNFEKIVTYEEARWAQEMLGSASPAGQAEPAANN